MEQRKNSDKISIIVFRMPSRERDRQGKRDRPLLWPLNLESLRNRMAALAVASAPGRAIRFLKLAARYFLFLRLWQSPYFPTYTSRTNTLFNPDSRTPYSAIQQKPTRIPEPCDSERKLPLRRS